MKKGNKENKAYQKVTDKIVDALERGVAPWKKGWASMAPQSIKNRPYRGINRLMTLLHMEENGFKDPRFITFDAQKKLGGSVKGQHGIPIVLWKTYKKKEKDPETGEITEKINRFPRAWTVFNVEQVSGVEFPSLDKRKKDNPPLEQAEAILDGYARPPEMTTSGSDKAYYSPSQDKVHLPERALFKSSEAYYSVAFHELTHSTGHPSRLNRFPRDRVVAPFGSPDYGYEELVAELGAAFLCSQCGIETEQEQSAAYIQGWLKNIKADKNLVPKAAQDAQKAVDRITGWEYKEEELD
jgi:antirestriction protein ArdC